MLCCVVLCAGSDGTAVVTPYEALLFADGRYHNQAEMELGSSWTLMRQGERERERERDSERECVCERETESD